MLHYLCTMQPPILEARHKPIVHRLFGWYLGRILKKDFNAIRWEGSIPPAPGKAMLVLGNHFSWWDGFFIYWLNRQHFHRTFYLMMLEKELRPRPVFRSLGAFSMNKGSRSMIHTLQYAAGLLRQPGNMVVVFPQGRLESQHTEYLHWQKGVMRIIGEVKADFQLVFSAAVTDYLDQRKPGLTIFLKEYTNPAAADFATIEQAYNTFYQECKSRMAEKKV